MVFRLLASVGDVPKSPAVDSLREAQQVFTASSSELIKLFHSAGTEMQIAFAIGAVIVAALMATVMVLVVRRPTNGQEALLEVIDRLDRLERAQQGPHSAQHLQSEVKGAIGYFKQELKDLRQICVAIHHHHVMHNHSGSTTRDRKLYAQDSEAGKDYSTSSTGRRVRRASGARVPTDKERIRDSSLDSRTIRARAGEIPSRLIAEARAALIPESQEPPAFIAGRRGK
jgi:hypothetical protein